MLAPLRFVWNATRGHRLTPWRSEYLRWRVETYSGQPAETLTAGKILSFVWATRWELLNFLLCTNQLEREVNRRALTGRPMTLRGWEGPGDRTKGT